MCVDACMLGHLNHIQTSYSQNFHFFLWKTLVPFLTVFENIGYEVALCPFERPVNACICVIAWEAMR